MKEMIQKINRAAQENWDKAQGMLEMFNMMNGTDFGWLNKRVVYFESDGKLHDALANVENF